MTSNAASGPSAASASALLDVLRALVGRVARAYYDTKSVVVLDILARVPYMREQDLAEYLKWSQLKEVQVAVQKLKKDRLVKTVMAPELIDGKYFQRPIHYIDYHEFLNITKLKIFKMQRKLSENVVTADQSYEYVCTGCNAVYDVFEGPSYQFICPIDSQQMEERPTDAAGVTHETVRRFNEQHDAITDLLKQLDKKKIPKPNFDELLKKPPKGEAASETAQTNGKPQPSNPSQPSTAIKVEGGMQSSCPGPETGLESLPQPSKPAEPRVVHKLPEWFRVSTVTGKDYKDDIVSPTTLKSPDKEKKEEEAEDEDTTYLRNYYARYGQTITQEAAQAEEQPAMVLAQPVPGHPAVAAAAAFLGGASPAPMVAHLDDDDDDEEFVEVDIGYENGAVGDKRKRLAEDVGG